MPDRPSDPFIVLARIGAPNGVRGAVRVKLFGDDPASLLDYGPLRRADGQGHLTISTMRPGKTPDMVVVSFDGIASREAAAALNGIELGLSRSLLPEVDDDDFYHADLIGLEVRLSDNSRFGQIVQVADYGAGDLLDVKPDRGGPSVLVPFTRVIVPEVKVREGHVVIDAPPGLLDPPKAGKPDDADGG